MINGNGSVVSYQYDRRNRLSNLAHKTAAGVLMLGMAYTVDASGLRTSIVETQQNSATTTQTRSAAYQYDDAQGCASVAGAGCAGATALKRLSHSTVTGATAAQNLSEVFTYDDAQGCASVAGAGCARATKVGNRLSRNCVGQIRTCNGGLTTSTSLSTVNTSNTYDSNDRLTREVWSTGYNATFDYAYDPAGNLLTKKQGTTTLAAYSWDVENRLVQAVMTPTGAAGNRTTSQYQYDASGIRRSSQVVAQIVGTGASITKTRTSFLVDPNQAYAQVLEDWTAKATQLGSTEPTLPEASLQNSYVFGDDLIAEARYAPLPPGAVGANAPGEGGNDPTARIGASTGTSAFHYDGLGSTRLLSAINLDAAGNPVTTGTAQNPANETITDHYAYSAFGESDLASTTGTTENNYRYTGEQLDPNLGWIYLRARYLNPGQGRFIGMDSWKGGPYDPISLHKYLYADASPVMYIDPSGHMTMTLAMAPPSLMSTLATISIGSASRLITTFAVRLLLVVGTAAISGSSAIINNENTLNQARIEQERRILAMAAVADASRLVFHYTDPVSAGEIMACRCIRATRGYNGQVTHGDGIYRPSGAYATPIPPWLGTMTQRDLAAFLWLRPGSRSVAAAVAIRNNGDWSPVTGIEWIKRAGAGYEVPVDAVIPLPNLMRP